MKSSCTVRSIDSRDLTESQFVRLNHVSQDMWAHWIWELVQCKCCWKMMSKQDAFWHLSKEIYDEAVFDIMRLLEINSVPCKVCRWETEFVYWEWHIENIKERLLQRPSHIVIAEDEVWKIVWYMDWYTDSLDWVFSREYYSHYKDIWVEEIASRVKRILWYLPEEMLVFSWIWFIEKHSNFFNLFILMKTFFETITTTIPANTPAISELDRNNNLYRLFNIIWFLALWIADNPELSSKVANKDSTYDSEMVIHQHPIQTIKRDFCIWVRDLLKLEKDKKPKIHTQPQNRILQFT